MLAAETDALPGGKVGGVGDVLRSLPAALADRGWESTVLTPAYGLFNRLPGALLRATVTVSFAGEMHSAEVWQVAGADPRVTQLAVEHPLLNPQGPGKIYCDDGPERPFATDANKFAFFCAAAAAMVSSGVVNPDVVHLHDWHSALYVALRDYDPRYRALQSVRTVFTIHNMAMQGIRPLDHDPSSLARWYPGIRFPSEKVGDPRYADCCNALATGIRLADKVNTVSPTYAREILLPGDPETGFSGGEGLERDAQAADLQGRLAGILNGCDYEGRKQRRPGWQRLLETIRDTLAEWPAGSHSALLANTSVQLKRLPRRRPRHLLTSVGRLTEQKVALFLTALPDGRTALEAILDDLGTHGVLIVLGSGNPDLEKRFEELAGSRRNMLFICGYSDTLATLLYRAGDLFLMPSSFEPCGISQMLAMRGGQPCVVHGVGGLRDTVHEGRTGFVFEGTTVQQQAADFVQAVRRAIELRDNSPGRWKDMCTAAAAARFSWSKAAEQYERELYAGP